MMASSPASDDRPAPARPRSLVVHEWPDADRLAWQAACRPGARLQPGGTASYLAQVSRNDYANRYGAFLGFLQRTDHLDPSAATAAQVTLANVEAYIADLGTRVRSVTVYICIYKLRRAAELLAPAHDFSWLAEIEKDLALVMEPRSKFDRLVLTERLVEAGLTLMIEAQRNSSDELSRARGIRNGLMIALLALCPIRIKNFAALELGKTFKQLNGRWWITLPSVATKSRRPDERAVLNILNPHIETYLKEARPLLLRSNTTTDALWISSTTGAPLTRSNLSTLISKITFETVGVDVSPHLFRTSAASTAAVYGGSNLHLASAVLNHNDPRVTEEHYNRPTSMNAGKIYAEIATRFLKE